MESFCNPESFCVWTYKFDKKLNFLFKSFQTLWKVSRHSGQGGKVSGKFSDILKIYQIGVRKVFAHQSMLSGNFSRFLSLILQTTQSSLSPWYFLVRFSTFNIFDQTGDSNQRPSVPEAEPVTTQIFGIWCIGAVSDQELAKKLDSFLMCCIRGRITLSRGKTFVDKTITFSGFKFLKGKIQPDDEKGLRRW